MTLSVLQDNPHFFSTKKKRHIISFCLSFLCVAAVENVIIIFYMYYYSPYTIVVIVDVFSECGFVNHDLV